MYVYVVVLYFIILTSQYHKGEEAMHFTTAINTLIFLLVVLHFLPVLFCIVSTGLKKTAEESLVVLFLIFPSTARSAACFSVTMLHNVDALELCEG